MALRHAGFAAVSTIDEGLINSLIEAAFINHITPLTFRLPSPLTVGSAVVTLAGEVTCLPPAVRLARRSDNLIAVRTRFVADLRLEGATRDPVDVAIELRCSLLVGLLLAIVNNRFQVGLDLSQATVTAVDVRVVDGPSLVSAYGAALRSAPVAAILTSVLRSIPPALLRTTIDGFPTTTHIAPRQMPCRASLFELPEMFHASFAISRIVPRVLDRALAIGVDIAEHSLGDPDRLESLFDVVRPVWVRTDNPDGQVDFSAKGVRGGGNLAVSVNPDVLVSLLERTLSPASYHAFVDCHVAIEGVSLSFGTFTPPLMPYNRILGSTLHVGARYYDSPGRDAQSRLTPGGISVHADVHIPFAVHYQMFDGPTEFVSGRGEYWFMKVYEADIDLPWWVTFGLILLGVTIPIFTLPAVAILDGILPSLLGNVANQVQKTAQSGIDKTVSEFELAPRTRTVTLPSLPKTPAGMTTNLISMTGEGIETYVTYTLATREDTSPDRHLTVVANGVRVRDGGGITCGIVDVRPVPCTVALDQGIVDPKDLSVRVSWEVRRRDTGAVVLQQDLPYSSSLRQAIALDPNHAGPTPRRIVIDRTDPAIMPVEEFSVVVRIYRPLYGRVKEFGSSRFSVSVMDRFDRHHPYVHWKGWAAGAPKQSAIHRTAVPGRCSMLMRAASRAKFLYLDELPFPVEQISEHREGLCDYCFFGGPDKFVPLI